jgi:hypothetical protein
LLLFYTLNVTEKTIEEEHSKFVCWFVCLFSSIVFAGAGILYSVRSNLLRRRRKEIRRRDDFFTFFSFFTVSPGGNEMRGGSGSRNALV